MIEIDDHNKILSRDPWEMLKDGDFSHIELMMGTNQDEGIQQILFISVLLTCKGLNLVGWIFIM